MSPPPMRSSRVVTFLMLSEICDSTVAAEDEIPVIPAACKASVICVAVCSVIRSSISSTLARFLTSTVKPTLMRALAVDDVCKSFRRNTRRRRADVRSETLETATFPNSTLSKVDIPVRNFTCSAAVNVSELCPRSVTDAITRVGVK